MNNNKLKCLNGIKIVQNKCLRIKLQLLNRPQRRVKIYLFLVFTSNSTSKVKHKPNKTTNKFNTNDCDVLPIIRSNQVQNHQKLLRSLLKEFNLQQYSKVNKKQIQKFYELGYDDDNIYKICLLTSGDRQELFRNLKVFPGHSYKMNQFIERVNEMYTKKGIPKQVEKA